jgi:hypothetical protein
MTHLLHSLVAALQNDSGLFSQTGVASGNTQFGPSTILRYHGTICDVLSGGRIDCNGSLSFSVFNCPRPSHPWPWCINKTGG